MDEDVNVLTAIANMTQLVMDGKGYALDHYHTCDRPADESVIFPCASSCTSLATCTSRCICPAETRVVMGVRQLDTSRE